MQKKKDKKNTVAFCYLKHKLYRFEDDIQKND